MIIGMTRKVKPFLHQLFNSIVPQNTYYAHIIKQGIRFSLSYFAVFLLLSSLLATGILYHQFSQNNPVRLEQCLQSSLKSVPADLSVHIQNGKLSTNQTMPVFIWFNCKDRLQLLAVVDERATKNDIFSYNAQALATSSDLVVRYRQYTYTLPYSKYTGELRATKLTLRDYMDAAVNLAKMYYPFVSVFFIILTPLVIFSASIITVLLSSLFVLVFFKILKRHYAYRTVVHVGMHSSSLPILTSLLFIVFPLPLGSAYALFFFLIFIFQLVGVYEAHYVAPLSHHK